MSPLISELIMKYNNQLTIKDLMVELNYEINDLYIDKFWNNIKDDKWIYINDELLEWFGYASNIANRYKNKDRYVELLKSNFNETIDFKQLNALEFKNVYVGVDPHIEVPKDINEHSKVKHLIVSPDTFKQSLMLLQTSKAKTIREYYVNLEKVFKLYLQYQSKFMENQLADKNKELDRIKNGSKQFKNIVLNKNIHKLDEYIYVMTSKNYAKQNIFKVGMTKDLDGRIRQYQVGRADNDKFHYVFIMNCVSAKYLEQMIFNRLEFFKYYNENNKSSNELYEIHYEILIKILKEFEEFEINSTKNINQYLLDYYENYQTYQSIDVNELAIQDTTNYIKEKFNIEPEYTSPYTFESNKSTLTTESINETLKNCNVKLVGEYCGSTSSKSIFECLSIFKHQFTITYDHLLRKETRGCYYCTKHGILDKILIYVYDNKYNYLYKYDEFEQLEKAEPEVDHKLIRNGIREKRWLAIRDDKYYSILAPDNNNQLNLHKELTNIEFEIIRILDIDYQEMISDKVFIIATDNINKKIYYGESMTLIGTKLTYVNGTKLINRKTISKHLNKNTIYGGYIWTTFNTIPINVEYRIINVLDL